MKRTENKPSKLVIAGGSGFLGKVLRREVGRFFDEVVILTRNVRKPEHPNEHIVTWDARTVGPWTRCLEGADLLINLTGRSVNCRYTQENRREILDSRVRSTLALGAGVIAAEDPPECWINASSATIYEGSRDEPQTEDRGRIGNDFSMGVCQKWEAAFNDIPVPGTRKVILRIGLVLDSEEGALGELRSLVRKGLGGAAGDGTQRMSWVHRSDFTEMLLTAWKDRWEGIFNCTAPEHPTNAAFMKTLRRIEGAQIGIDAPAWLVKLGAQLMGTEAELVLKSRFVMPKKALERGFQFKYPNLEQALQHLVSDEKVVA